MTAECNVETVDTALRLPHTCWLLPHHDGVHDCPCGHDW